MKQRFKNLVCKFKKNVLGKVTALAVVMSMTMVAACAAEGDSSGVTVDMTAITSAFSSGINTVITTSIQLLSIMLPAVLSFFAVKFVAVKGMGWFKQMAGK